MELTEGLAIQDKSAGRKEPSMMRQSFNSSDFSIKTVFGRADDVGTLYIQ